MPRRSLLARSRRSRSSRCPIRREQVEFLSRYDFHLSAAGLGSDDHARFMWDTHWGGDFDLVDYVNGRLSFLVDYQAVLGNEFRPFDPNQGNYTLEVSGSVRLGRTELVGVLPPRLAAPERSAEASAIAMNVLEGARAAPIRRPATRRSMSAPTSAA